MLGSFLRFSFFFFFFSLLQCTFTSHSPSSHRAFHSELPENICGFHAAPGAPGIQLSEVCGLRLGLSGSCVGPLKLPYLYALKPI